MLLVSSTNPETQYTGSVVPWKTNLNTGAPGKGTAYSRDWGGTVFGLLPVAGDQMMIERNYAYMTLTSWCAGASWTSTNAGCGGSQGHQGYPSISGRL